MKRHILSASTHGALSALLALGTVPAAGQETQQTTVTDDAPTVLAMDEAVDVMRVTVGHSKLLQSDEAFGTIIVGDDTIANATVGAENSLIVTGLSAGSTNLIVLGESRQILMSSTIAVVPVSGPLRSTVMVMKGVGMRERYECRGTDCTLIDGQDQPAEMSFLPTPVPGQSPSGAIAGETASESR